MRSMIFVATSMMLAGTAANAQLVAVTTDNTARVQLTLPSPPQLYSGTNISGIATDSKGSGGKYFSTSSIDYDIGEIDFKNGNVASGRYDYLTSATNIDITFKNGSTKSVRPSIESVIIPEGLGLYIADTSACVGDRFTGCPESATAAGFDHLISSSTGIGGTLAGASFAYRIRSNGEVVYELTGSLSLAFNPFTRRNEIVTHLDDASAELLNFTKVTPDGSATAIGYAWEATPKTIYAPLSQGLLDPGENWTFSYETVVSTYSQVRCATRTPECLVAYAAFGDPTGRRVITGLAVPFEASAVVPDLIPSVTVGTFGFKFPTYDPATGRLTLAAAAVPEPASWALMIAGFGMTGAALRRRSARSMA